MAYPKSSNQHPPARRALAILVIAALSGCGGGPRSLPVTGSVTLDEEPLAGALVSFVSQGEPQTNSIGITDEQGRYELQQSQTLKGLPVGSYHVHISTFRSPDDFGQGAVAERVPQRYNTRSTLEAIVKTGENQLDFELSSDSMPQSP